MPAEYHKCPHCGAAYINSVGVTECVARHLAQPNWRAKTNTWVRVDSSNNTGEKQ